MVAASCYRNSAGTLATSSTLIRLLMWTAACSPKHVHVKMHDVCTLVCERIDKANLQSTQPLPYYRLARVLPRYLSLSQQTLYTGQAATTSSTCAQLVLPDPGCTRNEVLASCKQCKPGSQLSECPGCALINQCIASPTVFGQMWSSVSSNLTCKHLVRKLG